MRFQFDISNRAFFFSALAVSFIILLSLAIAITAVNPGHTSNEVMISIGGAEKTLQAAIDDGSLGSAGFSRFSVFISSGNFVVPSGVTKVYVEAWGGGEGGGLFYSGSAGGYGASILTVTPGTSYPVVVGWGGGCGQDNARYYAAPGGKSSFGSLLTASGGGTSANPGGDTSDGQIKINGGAGSVCVGDGGGVRGGSAGKGGDGGFANVKGIAPGGGGGGCGDGGGSTCDGGVGGKGMVIVWY